jgi:hypothetical protein
MVADRCPVGASLMRKLGWSEGKGLGALEQGRQKPLLAQPKFDTCGIGAKASDAAPADLSIVLSQLPTWVEPLQTEVMDDTSKLSLDDVFRKLQERRHRMKKTKRDRRKRDKLGTHQAATPAKRPKSER